MVNNLAGTRELPCLFVGREVATLQGVAVAVTLLVDAYSIALGLTEQRIADVLGELILGNIGQDAASVDPAAVVAKGVFRHLAAHHFFPSAGITGYDDNAVLGEKVEADGDTLVAVEEGRRDESAVLEAEDVLRREIELIVDVHEVAADDLCRGIDHTVGVAVELHEGFYLLGTLLPVRRQERLLDVGDDDLACEQQTALLVCEGGQVGLLQFGREQNVDAVLGLCQTELGVAMGESERLPDADGQQRRFQTCLKTLVDIIREVVNHLLGQSELTENVERIFLSMEWFVWHKYAFW